MVLVKPRVGFNSRRHMVVVVKALKKHSVVFYDLELRNNQRMSLQIKRTVKRVEAMTLEQKLELMRKANLITDEQLEQAKKDVVGKAN